MEQRHLLLGAVGIVRGSVPGLNPAMVAVCNRLEPFLAESTWFPGAPFVTISIILRLGEADLDPTLIQSIQRTTRELPVARTAQLQRLRALRTAPDALVEAVLKEVVTALRAVAAKYSLAQLPALTESASESSSVNGT